jgi:hypothetical protein
LAQQNTPITILPVISYMSKLATGDGIYFGFKIIIDFVAFRLKILFIAKRCRGTFLQHAMNTVIMYK